MIKLKLLLFIQEIFVTRYYLENEILTIINAHSCRYKLFSVCRDLYWNITGIPVEFCLHENTRVSGEFKGCNTECSKIFVRNLETPMGMIPGAILRNSDLICLDTDINIDQWIAEKCVRSRHILQCQACKGKFIFKYIFIIIWNIIIFIW